MAAASGTQTNTQNIDQIMNIDNIPYTDPFQYPHRLNAKQNDQNNFDYINALQDYTIIIRKKQYYVARAADGGYEDDYVKAFQVNNFMNASVAISTQARSPGTLSVTIRGGEKVIVANQNSNHSITFDSIISQWNNVNTSSNGSLDYQQILATSFYQNGVTWNYAEKCDWAPMDEIYIFSKNLNLLGTQVNSNIQSPQFDMIFFGFINSVNRSYTSGETGLSIAIQASDQLKLLQRSYVITNAASDGSTGGAQLAYDTNGNLVSIPLTDVKTSIATGMFVGQYPNEIIKLNCRMAGIAERFITGVDGGSGRIEPVIRIPFVPDMSQTSNIGNMYISQYATRLSYCQQAADICNLEFFADEGGNIVLKIPTYTIGINRLSANNLGYPYETFFEPQNPFGSTQIATPRPSSTTGTTSSSNVTVSSSASSSANSSSSSSSGSSQPQYLSYTVKTGDNLWDIAGSILGNPTLWRTDIYNFNTNIIKDPHWIYPGQVLKILNPKYQPSKPSTAHKDAVTSQIQTQPQSQSQPQSQPQQDPVGSSPTLASKNDTLIPVIPPSLITSFTLTDSDGQVYTMVTVTGEQLTTMVSGQAPQYTTRTVEDPDMIRQFGLIPAPPANTTLLEGGNAAVLYADLLLLRSYMMRYTGTLSMIETPEISVGQPIRFHSYDEMPFPGGASDPAPNDPAQTVFYVVSTSRQINIGSQVSQMSLTLQAGRPLGSPTIFDQAQEIYRYFFDTGDTSAQIASTFSTTNGTSIDTGSTASTGNSNNSDSSTTRPTLQEGSGNPTAVKQLQTSLNQHGAHLTVDGSFGPLTLAAVKQFQTSNHLAVDGIVGPQTWGALTGSTGTSKTAPPPPQNTQQTSPSGKGYYATYTVKTGDTLWNIAEKFYSGNGNMFAQIATDNGIKYPNMLRVGTILRIYNYTSGVMNKAHPTL